MGKSKKRGGEKAHKKRVQVRNQRIKAQQDAFVKQFKQKLDDGVTEELEKQAEEVKNKTVGGTEERGVESTMSTPPIK
tara:strand:+ start:1509 stop:1742 length:234 start_codon:yes stop_codon:yes gene_type:complete